MLWAVVVFERLKTRKRRRKRQKCGRRQQTDLWKKNLNRHLKTIMTMLK